MCRCTESADTEPLQRFGHGAAIGFFDGQGNQLIRLIRPIITTFSTVTGKVQSTVSTCGT